MKVEIAFCLSGSREIDYLSYEMKAEKPRSAHWLRRRVHEREAYCASAQRGR